MTRIVCPHCHAPLATTELEQVLIDARPGLLCPECAGLVVLESVSREQLRSLEVRRTHTAHA